MGLFSFHGQATNYCAAVGAKCVRCGNQGLDRSCNKCFAAQTKSIPGKGVFECAPFDESVTPLCIYKDLLSVTDACELCLEGKLRNSSGKCENLQGTAIPDCFNYFMNTQAQPACRICTNGKKPANDGANCKDPASDANCLITQNLSSTGNFICLACKQGFYKQANTDCSLSATGKYEGCNIGNDVKCTGCNAFIGFYMTEVDKCTKESTLLGALGLILVFLLTLRI